jgi:hypothetical protein
MASLIASACHSTQNAEERRTREARAQSTPQISANAGAQPAGQQAQTGATTLKKVDLTSADRAAWRKALNWPNDCEEAYESTAGNDQAGLRFFELAPRQYLAEVRCAFGAYQREYRYMFYDESQTPPTAQLLTFKNYIAGDDSFESLEPEETTEMWGEARFDPKTRELTILNVFRGPGDCGSWARYGFEQGRPQLLEFRAKTACDGKPAGDPRKWRKVNLTPGNNPKAR